MPWYDLIFFVFIGALIGSGITVLLRPELSDRERAYRDEQREQHRKYMALTFSPGEKVWGRLSLVLGIGLIAYGLLR